MTSFVSVIYVRIFHKMGILTAAISVFLTVTCDGQIVNSMSPNKSGMYFCAVDTVVGLLAEEKNIGRIFIWGDAGDQIDKFPLKVHGFEIVNLPCKKDCAKRVQKGDVLLTLSHVHIVRDQISFALKAQQKKGRNFERFADYAYFFQFKYFPESRSYVLKSFRRGLMH